MFEIFLLILSFIIPLTLYLNRFLIPDTSFDTINYHLFIGQRGATQGLLPFGKGEFFPNGLFTFSPFYDIFNYWFYNLFGYRLGSILSLLSYFLIIFFVFKIIQLLYSRYFKSFNIINLILFVNGVIVFELLVQLATYYVDIINTLFIIIGIYLFLIYFKNHQYRTLLISSLFFGLAIFGKLVSLIIVVPLTFLLIFYFYKKRKLIMVVPILFLIYIPMFLFAVFLFRETGNPFFPFFNGIFKSVYYSVHNFKNTAFGGRNLWEIIFWPIMIFFNKNRSGEIENMFFDFKLSLYFFISLALIIFNFRKNFLDLKEKLFIFIFLAGYYLWSFLFGYLRYATALEILGGIILIIYFNKVKIKTIRYINFILLIIVVIHNIRILGFNFFYDYSWRLNFYKNSQLHKKQISFLLKDKTIKIPDKYNQQLKQTDFIINCVYPSSGYFIFLSQLKNKPMLLSSSAAKYIGMTDEYIKHSRFLLKKFINQSPAYFVAVVMKEGLNEKYDECKNNLLKEKGFKILTEYHTADFLGYENQRLSIIFGEVNF